MKIDQLQYTREALNAEKSPNKLLKRVKALLRSLWDSKRDNFQRVLPLGEYFVERDEKAAYLGFGPGTTIYDSSVVLGKVKVGSNTWIGPFVMLDGSGELEIGSHCSISTGVQIYSHDSIEWAVSGGQKPYIYAKTIIGDRCYIGPNTIIQKGVTIGDGCIIGANSFVNCDIPTCSKAVGSPIRITGNVSVGPAS